MKVLQAFDQTLLNTKPRKDIVGFARFLIEFWYFGIKEARACLFAGLFFFSVFALPKAGVWGLPRYDVLLVIAISIQGWMLWSKLETYDELKAICIFHLVGFALEVFKTSSGIKSWSYPDFAYSKVFGVPLFSGFMYAAVGSYVIQAWRLFDLRVIYHPPHWMAASIATLIYANFFTHHFIGDYRWYIAALAMGLYAGKYPSSCHLSSSGFSFGLQKTSAHSLAFGSIQTKWGLGQWCTSANGALGRCLS
jgi:uncharacterized membrane protein YoaT (DUF817 family)